MGLLDALKQYVRDASPGGLLNPEVAPGVPTEIAKGLLGFTPGIGDAISGYDAVQAARNGNYGEAALNAVGVLPFVPSFGGMIAKSSKKAAEASEEALRMKRMNEMGMERGWYRGGPEPKAGSRTGPWYTKDPEEAAAYAKRFGKEADVREYAIPSDRFFNTDASYPPAFANDVANLLSNPYYEKVGADLARDLRQYYVNTGERVPGYEMWNSLRSRYGNDGAAEVLQELGKFSGAKGITHGNEAYVFKTSPIRDANKAQFDPAKRHVDDIYGHADPRLLSAMATGGLLGLGVWSHKRDSE